MEMKKPTLVFKKPALEFKRKPAPIEYKRKALATTKMQNMARKMA